MEKVLLQALALKPKLSQPQKDRLAGLIVGLGVLEPSRGQKLGKLQGNQ